MQEFHYSATFGQDLTVLRIDEVNVRSKLKEEAVFFFSFLDKKNKNKVGLQCRVHITSNIHQSLQVVWIWFAFIFLYLCSTLARGYPMTLSIYVHPQYPM